MMTLFLKGHRFVYEMENVLRCFVAEVKIEQDAPPHNTREDYAYLRLTEAAERCNLLCMVQFRGIRMVKDARLPRQADKGQRERTLAGLLYDVMASQTGWYPEWGIVTGVRPGRLAALLIEQTGDEQAARWALMSDYRVSAAKAALTLKTLANGSRLATLNSPRSYSLYLAIPFCPSRCSYCSFISKTPGRDHQLIDDYLARLGEELKQTADIAQALNLRLESIYIGGGTPSMLSERQLAALLDAVSTNFPVADAREYTIEAGRPDTLTQGKLEAMKAAKVTRISINPQTGDDAILRAIGRGHTRADIERAFSAARTAGFDRINADVIAGLPGDSREGFGRTLDWLLGLKPENITVHALTLKRASLMTQFGDSPAKEAAGMIQDAEARLEEAGYQPYYMYKQKGTVEALENTGYALPGSECLYNLYMMDELHTVLACGAGAVTKLVNPYSGRIERIFNYKYPAEYIAGLPELSARKERIKTFYEEFI